MISLKDLRISSNGSSNKPLGFKASSSSGDTVFYDPPINLKELEELEFHFKCHSPYWCDMYLGFGTGNSVEYPLGHDMNGWSLKGDSPKCYHNGIFKKVHPDLYYRSGYVVQFKITQYVNRLELQAKLARNKNWAKVWDNIPHWKAMEKTGLRIGGSAKHDGMEFELVYFNLKKSLSHPECHVPSKKEKKEEELTLQKTEKYLEEMKESFKRLEQTIENERREREKKLSEQASLIQSLSSQLERNEQRHEEEIQVLRNSVEQIKKRFLDHDENYHRTKYIVKSLTCSSIDIQKGKDNEFLCLEGAKGEFELNFDVSEKKSHDGVDEKELKLFLNNSPIPNFECMGKTIDFNLEFKKPGKHELLVEYKNAKRMYPIIVSSSTLSQEKSQILMQKKGAEEPKEKFQITDEIEVILEFRNGDGFGLPFRCFEDKGLTMQIRMQGSSKIVQRALVDLEEESYLGDGKIFGCSFRMKKGLKGGKYRMKVFDDVFVLEKDFEVF